ncbi:MAG: L-rhamnose mutarotase [Firmicutes bacterium]|nr:L-rhamnose mutarotase [Bacillota bacterium]
MARVGFVMRLKHESAVDEYLRLHRDIDEEVLAAHRRAGIRNYSIYRHGLTLFAYFEADDPHGSLERLAREPVMERWWSLTGPLMETDERGRPRVEFLQEAFYME